MVGDSLKLIFTFISLDFFTHPLLHKYLINVMCLTVELFAFSFIIILWPAKPTDYFSPTPTLTTLHCQCSEICILPHLTMEYYSFTLVVKLNDNKWDKEYKRTNSQQVLCLGFMEPSI